MYILHTGMYSTFDAHVMHIRYLLPLSSSVLAVAISNEKPTARKRWGCPGGRPGTRRIGVSRFEENRERRRSAVWYAWAWPSSGQSLSRTLAVCKVDSRFQYRSFFFFRVILFSCIFYLFFLQRRARPLYLGEYDSLWYASPGLLWAPLSGSANKISVFGAVINSLHVIL